jgi:hypothetical protein
VSYAGNADRKRKNTPTNPNDSTYWLYYLRKKSPKNTNRRGENKQPMLSEDEAIQLIKNTSKYSHALLVSAIMVEIARN